MSNIHGLGNLPRNSNNNNDRRFGVLGGMDDSSQDPRTEGFFQFLKNFCCPTFVFKSVTFYISIIDVIIYLITLLYGINLNPNELLAPKTDVLDKFGMKVWRKKIYI